MITTYNATPIADFLDNTPRRHQTDACLYGQGLQHFDVHDLPYLGKLMVGEGTRVSTEISPHFEIHCTTTFQLIHFGISGERNFKPRQICAFSYGWVCHSVTSILHFAGDRVVSLFGMQNIIYEKLNRILQWLQFLHKTFFSIFHFHSYISKQQALQQFFNNCTSSISVHCFSKSAVFINRVFCM